MASQIDGSTNTSGLVIWVTGAPFSGKTSTATELCQLLRGNYPATVIHLDGDLLRMVLGTSNVHSDEGRRQLGITYARLAKALARQGVVVVVSVVAMYREVFLELSSSPHCEYRAFFLDSEPAIRQQRAMSELGSYTQAADPSQKELPNSIHRIANSRGDEIRAIASEIYQVVRDAQVLQGLVGTEAPSVLSEIREFGIGISHRQEHWNQVYSSHPGLLDPSSFAHWFASRLEGHPTTGILDFGCGNGRDSVFLAEFAPVVGMDSSHSAVSLCRRTWNHQSTEAELSFVEGNHHQIGEILRAYGLNVFYSRFVWHSLTREEESAALDALQAALESGGLLALEARTTSDPLYLRGAKVSSTERVAGHYRRFVNVDSLIAGLESTGFVIENLVQGRGLAVLGDDDPDVVRILARKR